jgi:hypothetical protein
MTVGVGFGRAHAAPRGTKSPRLRLGPEALIRDSPIRERARGRMEETEKARFTETAFRIPLCEIVDDPVVHRAPLCRTGPVMVCFVCSAD